ncbi:hypothetical protein HHSLTHF2_30000 [Vreelandella venusta]|jgi:hypothetical protein|uniref:Uncharacterized protein n=1 Tax=Halomonas hydrothermalis TaxID=115561 RepID=A0A6F8U848_9GAMM|nr:hypothetical protein HHSLTHF2_30000 [Halomonas hydrothermalis]
MEATPIIETLFNIEASIELPLPPHCSLTLETFLIFLSFIQPYLTDAKEEKIYFS